MKAINRIVFCLALVLMLTAAIPVFAQNSAEETVPQETTEETVMAEPLTEEEALCLQIEEDYEVVLEESGKESLGGFCGYTASLQLHHLGINSYFISFDGNKQYDHYSTLEQTSGGYTITPYSVEDYSMEDALNEITDSGKEDAYNLLVCFEWTNTEAGDIYGHTVFVYAILDGKVYFTESFETALGTKEGETIVVTIPEFVKYYDDWTIFEGIIVFGKKENATELKRTPTKFYGVSEKPLEILSDLPLPDKTVQTVRTVPAGERLFVTDVYKDEQGGLFYRIVDSGTDGYVPAADLTPVQFCTEDVVLSDAAIPQTIKKGGSFSLTGTVSSQHSKLTGLTARITDEAGKQVLSCSPEKLHGKFVLEGESCDLSNLPKGAYYYTLTAKCTYPYVKGDNVLLATEQIELVHQFFYVGTKPQEQAARASLEQEVPDGWVYDGVWYYYKDGAPYSGWLRDNEIDYYLKEDGSITTGFAMINGKERFFSSTGAMRTGWMEREEGRVYLLRNGVTAKGLRKIDGKYYFFGTDGAMRTDSWAEHNGYRYFLTADGEALTGGWQELPDGTFFFHSDGRALMQRVEEEGEQRIVALTKKVKLRAKCLVTP